MRSSCSWSSIFSQSFWISYSRASTCLKWKNIKTKILRLITTKWEKIDPFLMKVVLSRAQQMKHIPSSRITKICRRLIKNKSFYKDSRKIVVHDCFQPHDSIWMLPTLLMSPQHFSPVPEIFQFLEKLCSKIRLVFQIQLFHLKKSLSTVQAIGLLTKLCKL